MHLKRQSVKSSLLKSYLLLDSAALFSRSLRKIQKPAVALIMPISIHACLQMSNLSHDPVPFRRKVFWVVLNIFSLSMQVEKVTSVAI
jgi:hypothetical protein